MFSATESIRALLEDEVASLPPLEQEEKQRDLASCTTERSELEASLQGVIPAERRQKIQLVAFLKFFMNFSKRKIKQHFSYRAVTRSAIKPSEARLEKNLHR